MSNVTVVQSRVEEYEVDNKFDGITVRALAAIGWIFEKARDLIKKNGAMYLMLAKTIDIPSNLQQCSKIMPLDVPYLQADRRLLIINNPSEL